jgi:hypothetical protein
MEAGFVEAKAALGRATWLGHPNQAARLALHVYALLTSRRLFISSLRITPLGSLLVFFHVSLKPRKPSGVL